MSKQAIALIAGLLVIGLLVVGCGGDDDGNDASAGSPGAESTSASAGSEADDGGDVNVDGAEADEGDESIATITKASLIKQGDQICKETVKRIATQGSKLFEGAGKGDDGKEGGNFQVEVAEGVIGPEFQTLADDLEALGVPSGDEEQVEALIDTLRERGDLASDDPEGFFDLEGETGGPLEKQGEVQAKQYGFKQCMQA